MLYDKPNDKEPRDLRGTDEFFMWSNHWHQFVSRHMHNIVCDECGEKYNDDGWFTEAIGRDGDMLTCSCGQQFYQTLD